MRNKINKFFIILLMGMSFISAGAQQAIKWKMDYPEPIQSPHPLPVDGLLIERPFGYYNLTKEDGKFVLVIGYAYESAYGFIPIEGKGIALARVKAGGKYGYISPDGYPVVKCSYDDASNFNQSGYAMVQLNGKWGIIDYQGEPSVPCVYDTMSDMCNGWYEVSKGDAWGYVSAHGTYAASYSEYELLREK